MSVVLEGDERFLRSLDAAAHELADSGDLEDLIAQVIAARAEQDAPRRTGALAATVAARGEPGEVRVVAGGSQVDYARPVHVVDPFIARAAYRTESEWTSKAEQYLDDLVDTIKGA